MQGGVKVLPEHSKEIIERDVVKISRIELSKGSSGSHVSDNRLGLEENKNAMPKSPLGKRGNCSNELTKKGNVAVRSDDNIVIHTNVGPSRRKLTDVIILRKNLAIKEVLVTGNGRMGKGNRLVLRKILVPANRRMPVLRKKRNALSKDLFGHRLAKIDDLRKGNTPKEEACLAAKCRQRRARCRSHLLEKRNQQTSTSTKTKRVGATN